ncbi:N/A [soil metagenome]
MVLSLYLILFALPEQSFAGGSCGFTAISPVAFGSYKQSTGPDTTSIGSITVTCTNKFAASSQFTLSLSRGSSGSYNQRTLKNGSRTLNYNLYIKASMSKSQIWGDGSGSTEVVKKNASGVQTATVYGEIDSGQSVAAGGYSDTIIITLDF